MRSTIRNVAEEAGVSTATVSLVLRGINDRTTPETRERVLRVAKRLNYLSVKPPTSQNRPLETRIVTLVPQHWEMEKHDLDMMTYQGIISSARHHGYDILTLVGQNPTGCAERGKSRYLDRHSDGFIFSISDQGAWEQDLQLVAEHGIPTVVCYRQDAPQGVATADVDNEGAMHQAVRHLVDNGHRCIAYAAGPPDNFNEQTRRLAWLRAMRLHDLETSERMIVPGTESDHLLNNRAIATVSQLGATAVVCFNDSLALRLWDQLEAQGLSVPRDMSIISVDNLPAAAQRGLTTFAHSFQEVGRLAMEAWIALKNGGDALTCSQLAPVQLMPRASVRCLNPS